MNITLVQPIIGNTNWGSDVNNNWQKIQDALNGVSASAIPPVGTVFMYAGSSAPAGWLACDGHNYTVAAYPILGALLGTNFGGSAGVNFNVPNLSARFPVGVGSGSGSLSVVPLGGSGGEADHVLSIPELPAHSHGYSTFSGALSPHGNGAQSGTAFSGLDILTSINNTIISGTTDQAGAGSGHNNVPPWLGLTFIIKCDPV